MSPVISPPSDGWPARAAVSVPDRSVISTNADATDVVEQIDPDDRRRRARATGSATTDGAADGATDADGDALGRGGTTTGRRSNRPPTVAAASATAIRSAAAATRVDGPSH